MMKWSWLLRYSRFCRRWTAKMWRDAWFRGVNAMFSSWVKEIMLLLHNFPSWSFSFLLYFCFPNFFGMPHDMKLNLRKHLPSSFKLCPFYRVSSFPHQTDWTWLESSKNETFVKLVLTGNEVERMRTTQDFPSAKGNAFLKKWRQ